VLLDDVKIVSFCHFLQGPAAVQYLADMGADVIKVEPIQGAHERHWSGANVFVGGVSGFFLCANRNKRSIALDLKSDEGCKVAKSLISQADIVVENFRPGVMDRLGLGYEEFKDVRPDLIFASASGFGATGPDANRPGQDLLIQARAGLVAATGNPKNLPSPVGCAAADQHGAALLAMGILGAYVRRLKTNVGTWVEANLLNAGIDLQMEALTNYASGNRPAQRFERQENLATWFHEAPYGIYRTTNGAIALSLNDPHELAKALQSEALTALADADRHADRDQYAQAVADEVIRFSTPQIGHKLDTAKLWWAPVCSYDDLLDDPQVLHNNVFQQIEINGEMATLVSHPIRYDGEVMPIRHIATSIGHDGIEILNELGFSTSEIERLRSSGAVGLPQPADKSDSAQMA